MTGFEPAYGFFLFLYDILKLKIFIFCGEWVTIKHLKDMLPFLGIIALDFYLLPMLIKDMGTAMLMLLIVEPSICFICSLIYGLKKPFSIFYSAIAAILFVPSIFVFYNSSAWVYIIGYGIIALMGSVIGMSISKRAK